MIRQPKWKDSFRIEQLAPDSVFLLSERGKHILSGKIYYQMATLLDGSNSVPEIVNQINGDSSFLQISQTLARLQKKGFIVEADEGLSADITFLCHILRIDGATAKRRLQQTTVFVHNMTTQLDVSLFTEQLHDLGIQVAEKQEGADLCIVLVEDYLNPALEQLNQIFLKRQQNWLLVKPFGTTLQIGPLFQSEELGCWACLSHRLSLHQRVQSFLETQLFSDDSSRLAIPMPSFSTLIDIGLNWAMLEILKWILEGENETLTNHVTTIDIHLNEMEEHVFTPRPQCPVCGDLTLVSKRTQKPIELKHQAKHFTMDGGHRSVSPADTMAKYRHHVSQVTGIIGQLRQIDFNHSNGLINSYYAGVNISFQPNNYTHLRSMFKHSDGGKGVTLIQSKASGLCEALERYSICYQGDEYSIRASYQSLGEKAIHPNYCLNFSKKQYENGIEWNNNINKGSFNHVPVPFDDMAIIDWTPVWSLTEKTFKYLPTMYCYFMGGKYGKDQILSVPACSNGNAAGNTLEEAFLQGFMELVERDSVAIWWYNRLRRPGVDLASFKNEYITKLQTYYESLERDLWVLDLSSDMGIPVFVALSRQRNQEAENIISGFGAHFDPQVALLRALTEVNQCLASFFNPDNPNPPSKVADEKDIWWKTATLEKNPYLLPQIDAPLLKAENYPKLWHDDIYDDVMKCVDLAQQQGLETLMLDQTQPDVGLNVVKVFVPGMRHFWRRLAPGRLYDVPVKMGWLDKPILEDELNPFSVFL